MNEIDVQAAEWASRADVTAVDSDAAAALEAWLAADPRHLGAYLKMRATAVRVETAGSAAFALADQLGTPGTNVVPLRSRATRRIYWVGAMAAGLAVVITAGALWQHNRFDAVYATGLGKTERVALPDGSVMTLNSASSIRVHYSLLERDIKLEQGEALFDVAKNKARPFVVGSGEARVKAVGTSFSVSASNQTPFHVIVREGVVEIAAPVLNAPVRVAAGYRADTLGGRLTIKSESPEQITNDLAWREGLIVFRRQTLAAAAKEFSRYSATRIVIDDPAVAAKTVTGTYAASDPAGFAKAMAIAWNLTADQRGSEVRLSQKN